MLILDMFTNHLFLILSLTMQFQGLICLFFSSLNSAAVFSASQCSLFNGGIKAHPLNHPPHIILLTPGASTSSYSSWNQHSIYCLGSTHEYAHFCLIYISFFVFVEGLAFKEREKMFGKEKLFSVLGSSRANIICILINLFLWTYRPISDLHESVKSKRSISGLGKWLICQGRISTVMHRY